MGRLRKLVVRFSGLGREKLVGGIPEPLAARGTTMIEQLSAIDDIGSRLQDIRIELEHHVSRSVEREQRDAQRYDRLLAAVLLLLDYVESKNTAGEELAWFHGKVQRILEDESIEEIPVRIGERFEAEHHRHACNRPHKSPQGSVLQVVRKGYWRIDENEKTVVRPAEVIVSSGLHREADGTTDGEGKEDGEPQEET